jgi:hypothetical protein
MNSHIYPIQLLNDIHNWYPDILYNPGRFRNVQDLLDYIRQGADTNPYTRGLQAYNQISRQHGNLRTHHTSSAPSRNVSQPVTRPVSQPVSYFTNTISPSTVSYFTNPPSTNDPLSSISSISNILNSLLNTDTISTTSPISILPINITSFLDQRVDVAPNSEEIRNATSIITPTRNMTDNCAICQDEMLSGQELRRINHCNHMYHRECIDVWFNRNVHCPTCRHDIRINNSENTASTDSNNSTNNNGI